MEFSLKFKNLTESHIEIKTAHLHHSNTNETERLFLTYHYLADWKHRSI